MPERNRRDDGVPWYSSPATWEALKPAAREMRRDPTPAEEALWQHLRAYRADGFAFRRQHVFGRFVVDFCCPRARLVIELDGGIHVVKRGEDRARDAALAELGLRVLRFSNDEVLHSLAKVLQKIAQELRRSGPPCESAPEH